MVGFSKVFRFVGGRGVCWSADWSAPGLEATVGTLRGEGHEVEGHTVDVSQRDSVENLAEAAGAAGRVDAVVHTAGVSPVMASARQIYEVDLLGTAHVIDAFLPVASAGTSLVCVASMAGHFASLYADLERHLATPRPMNSWGTRSSASTPSPLWPTWWPSPPISCACRPPPTPGGPRGHG